MNEPDRIDQLMDEFARAWRTGEADPRAYLADLDAGERREMEVRIQLFLDRVGPDPWDPDVYRGSLSEQVVEGVLGDAQVAGGEDLIAMRVECGLGKREVADSLAEDLGANSENDRRKISDYYHRLEWGTLDPSAVSRRVIDSIATILGTDRQQVTAAIPGPGAASHEVFARLAGEGPSGEPGQSMATPSVPSSDWIDELFLGADREQG